MKASILLAAVAALAVPATAAPLKRDAAPVAVAEAQRAESVSGNPFGKWNDDGTFEFTIDWQEMANRFRRPKPTAVNQQLAAEPTPTAKLPAEKPAGTSSKPCPYASSGAGKPAATMKPEQPEQPTPEPGQPEQPSTGSEQPSTGSEQPSTGSEQPEQPSTDSEPGAPAPVDSSSAEQPTDATAANPPAAKPSTQSTKNSGEPTFPFADDKTMISADSTAADIAGSTAASKLALEYHNQWRAQFGASALTWDSGLAQKAANAMGTCKWEHIGADNLSAKWNWGSGPSGFPAHECMDGWAGEWNLYDYNNPNFSDAAGHFTAMTWKAVTKVGCGWKLGCKDASPGSGQANKIFFSCVYDPAPNMGGAFEENVPRLGGN